MILGVSAGGLFLLSAILEQVPAMVFSLGGLVLAAMLWLLFGKFVARCRVV